MFTFTVDEYTKRRGEPALLKLHCHACGHHVFYYQKDGPGPLLRCYWDRIFDPHITKDIPISLSCAHCSTRLGKTAIYEKENRLAFFLEENRVDVQEITSEV